MSQEIYVKEMPRSCKKCPCSFEDVSTCKWCNADKFPVFISDKIYKQERLEDCPLKNLNDHDKELVEKVLEKVKNETYKDGFYDENGEKIITYHISNYILDQIQKEYEK